jgi:hypothetical protein
MGGMKPAFMGLKPDFMIFAPTEGLQRLFSHHPNRVWLFTKKEDKRQTENNRLSTINVLSSTYIYRYACIFVRIYQSIVIERSDYERKTIGRSFARYLPVGM